MTLGLHCTRCGTFAAPDHKFCGDCGAELGVPTRGTQHASATATSLDDAGTGASGDAAAPPVTTWQTLKANTLKIGLTATLAVIAFLVSYNGLRASAAFSDPANLILCALGTLSLAFVALTLGWRSVAYALLHLLMFLSGGLIFSSLAISPQAEQSAFTYWRLWTIYAGIYAFIVVVWPKIRAWMREGRELTPRLASVLENARETQFEQEASLRRLPSHSWYLLATWVTGATMVGSFITTALGLHSEIVDPYDHWILAYGVPIGLSALASLIIWAGWNFVFLRLRLADAVWRRVAMFAVGLGILTPLTLAIHTVFGIIGVGGTEGLRAHHLWYSDVLSIAYDHVEAERQSELRLAPTMLFIRDKFQSNMQAEEKGGTGCGAGQGELFRYYRERVRDAENLINKIDQRKTFAAGTPEALSSLRAFIENPGQRFSGAQVEISKKFKELRSDILQLQGRSIRGTTAVFLDGMKLVENDAFFTGWPECQLQRRKQIEQEIGSFKANIEAERQRTEDDIRQADARARLTNSRERRIESLPFIDRLLSALESASAATLTKEPDAGAKAADPTNFSRDIPTFIPLRPFWAVVTYASKLPGYVALQLALDFSPAVLGLLFALLAPLPSHTMRPPQARPAAAEDTAAVTDSDAQEPPPLPGAEMYPASANTTENSSD